MDLKKEFFKECGVDLTDYEYAGKFPSQNKHGVWGNIPRGEGWKRYSEWLENKLNNNVIPSFDSPRNWKEDYEHENGNYTCICIECKESFIGHKRRVICKECMECRTN